MLELGVTTCEVKSGYGLSVQEELKILRVIKALANEQVVELVPTFLGAHAVPEEYLDCPEEYVHLIIREMLPAVASETLRSFAMYFVKMAYLIKMTAVESCSQGNA